MQRIRDDIDNLVAAWERAVARGDTDCAQRTAQPLIDFYASRGPYSRERDIIKQTWALPVNDPSVRACFAVFASRAYGRHGDMENCSALLDHANQFREVLVDEGLDLELTYALGMQANHKGEFDEATRVFAEVIEEARARGQWHTVARAATASGTTLQLSLIHI